jgi:propionyl-CoA carboxylase alpha chain
VKIGERFVAVEVQGDGSARETPLEVRAEGSAVVVTIGGKARRIELASPLASVAVQGNVDGKPFRAQVERAGVTLRVAHDGARAEVRVLTPRAAELRALMPWKPPPDLTRFLLSPMPGLLVQVAVQAGQAVRAGERLAVIEAMKMENVVVATHDGVVAKIVATPGESVAVDEVILEFAEAEAKR